MIQPRRLTVVRRSLVPSDPEIYLFVVVVDDDDAAWSRSAAASDRRPFLSVVSSAYYLPGRRLDGAALLDCSRQTDCPDTRGHSPPHLHHCPALRPVSEARSDAGRDDEKKRGRRRRRNKKSRPLSERVPFRRSSVAGWR